MCYKTGKFTVFEARPWLFRPGHFKRWGSGGVNSLAEERDYYGVV